MNEWDLVALVAATYYFFLCVFPFLVSFTLCGQHHLFVMNWRGPSNACMVDECVWIMIIIILCTRNELIGVLNDEKQVFMVFVCPKSKERIHTEGLIRSDLVSMVFQSAEKLCLSVQVYNIWHVAQPIGDNNSYNHYPNNQHRALATYHIK